LQDFGFGFHPELDAILYIFTMEKVTQMKKQNYFKHHKTKHTGGGGEIYNMNEFPSFWWHC
jgi:hypothetical protein